MTGRVSVCLSLYSCCVFVSTEVCVCVHVFVYVVVFVCVCWRAVGLLQDASSEASRQHGQQVVGQGISRHRLRRSYTRRHRLLLGGWV